MFFKIESWNFQHLFEKAFGETSQNFNSIRQLIEKFEIKIVWISWMSWNFAASPGDKIWKNDSNLQLLTLNMYHCIGCKRISLEFYLDFCNLLDRHHEFQCRVVCIFCNSSFQSWVHGLNSNGNSDFLLWRKNLCNKHSCIFWNL